MELGTTAELAAAGCADAPHELLVSHAELIDSFLRLCLSSRIYVWKS